MTLAFLLFTGGTTLIYTSLKNMTLADILLNRPSTVPAVDVFGGSSSTGQVPGASGGSISGKAGQAVTGGNSTGSSTYKGVEICNWIIAIIQAAEKDVGPLQPTSGVRHGCDPHTSGPSCHSGCGPGLSCGTGCDQGTGAVDFGGYGGSPDAEKFRAWLKSHGNPMIGGASYGDLGHFSRSGH